MSQIVKGSSLMMFIDGKSVGFATNHTLSISPQTSSIASKDHGLWGASEITSIEWEITSENLYTSDGYDAMYDALIKGDPIELVWGIKAESDPTKTVADGDYENWTPATGHYKGSAFLTSLVANAPNGENATFSCTFSGAGKFARVSA